MGRKGGKKSKSFAVPGRPRASHWVGSGPPKGCGKGGRGGRRTNRAVVGKRKESACHYIGRFMTSTLNRVGQGKITSIRQGQVKYGNAFFSRNKKQGETRISEPGVLKQLWDRSTNTGAVYTLQKGSIEKCVRLSPAYQGCSWPTEQMGGGNTHKIRGSILPPSISRLDQLLLYLGPARGGRVVFNHDHREKRRTARMDAAKPLDGRQLHTDARMLFTRRINVENF